MDPRRHLKLWLLILLPLIVIASTFLLFWTERLPAIARKRPTLVHPPPDIRLPPLYETYHASELGLPQHKWHDRRPGEHEKFFFVAGYARGVGWSDALQDHLLNAYLGYQSNRPLVFGNYTWDDTGRPYSLRHGRWIPSQIPYSATIRVDGTILLGDHHIPLAVKESYFDRVCPSPVVINLPELQDVSSTDLVDIWTDILTTNNESCLQYPKINGPIFTRQLTSGPGNILPSLFPKLAASPIVTSFGYSPLVETAFEHNRHFFVSPLRPASPALPDSQFTTNAERYTPIPGLMTIHVPRADWATHCAEAERERATFVGMNAHPDLPPVDAFVIPSELSAAEPQTSENHTQLSGPDELYRSRCSPNVEEIVRKVEGVRVEQLEKGVKLDRLYVVTDPGGDEDAFMRELMGALWAAQSEWDSVASGGNLVLDWEQQFVSEAVDMLVAQRAEVFVGNGFTILSSNVVMMRLANGFAPESIRFF